MWSHSLDLLFVLLYSCVCVCVYVCVRACVCVCVRVCVCISCFAFTLLRNTVLKYSDENADTDATLLAWVFVNQVYVHTFIHIVACYHHCRFI